MADKEEPEADIPDENSNCMAISTPLLLRPVSAGESGVGLPYAPIDFPNPGDNWRWKVGMRKYVSGFWFDRYLYPPKNLPNTAPNKRRFSSRLSVDRYIRKHFPNADVDAFFASFSWKIPSIDDPSAKGYVRKKRSRKLTKEESASKFGIMGCEARNSMTKIKSGTYPEDILKVEGSMLTTSTADISHPGNNSIMLSTLEVVKEDFKFTPATDYKRKKSQESVYITSDYGTASVKLQNEINQVLQDLKKSQEFEYRIAEERLYAQKDFILALYQGLDVERSELAKHTSPTPNSDFDASLNIILNRVNQIKEEDIKLGNMEEVSQGFGRASKSVLKEHFGVEVKD